MGQASSFSIELVEDRCIFWWCMQSFSGMFALFWDNKSIVEWLWNLCAEIILNDFRVSRYVWKHFTSLMYQQFKELKGANKLTLIRMIVSLVFNFYLVVFINLKQAVLWQSRYFWGWAKIWIKIINRGWLLQLFGLTCSFPF